MASQEAKQLIDSVYIKSIDNGISRAEALAEIYQGLIADGMDRNQQMKQASGLGLVYKDVISKLVEKNLLLSNGDIQSVAPDLAKEIRDSYLSSDSKTIKDTQGYIASHIQYYDPIVNSNLILQYFICAIEQGSNQNPGRVGCFQQLLKDTGVILSSKWTQEEIIQGLYYDESPECLARIKSFAQMIGLTANAASKSSVQEIAKACIDELSLPITLTQQQRLEAAKVKLNERARQRDELAQSRSDQFWNQDQIEAQSSVLTRDNNLGLRVISMTALAITGFFVVKSIKDKS